MDSIIIIEGNVTYNITLDPGVWIFDDRRIDLLTYFDKDRESTDELVEYTKAVSKQWDREIREGAIFPPTLKSEKKFEKEKVLTGTFGIQLRPFLQNAAPVGDAKELIIVTKSENISVPIEIGFDAILGFSKEGKPLKEDGPVHFYFGDGSNRLNPITSISKFIIK